MHGFHGRLDCGSSGDCFITKGKQRKVVRTLGRVRFVKLDVACAHRLAMNLFAQEEGG